MTALQCCSAEMGKWGAQCLRERVVWFMVEDIYKTFNVIIEII